MEPASENVFQISIVSKLFLLIYYVCFTLPHSPRLADFANPHVLAELPKKTVRW